mmetsp:Transcript_12477/g.36129  ORF Transcript_12477/g.36129 Transcript_12477/m.36129 type:complete len:240 (+) Transcript_12477:1703-2422(+)
MPRTPSKRWRRAVTLPRKASRNSGAARRRRVCPVGAVSMITRSYPSPSALVCAACTTSLSATSSSMPGGGFWIMATKSWMPSFDTKSAAFCPPTCRAASVTSSSSTTCWNRSRAAWGSTSIASKLSAPGTGRAGNAVASASPREWAGSVDTTKVRNPASLMATPSAAAVDVFPTPPFPPTKMNLGPPSPEDSSTNLWSPPVAMLSLSMVEEGEVALRGPGPLHLICLGTAAGTHRATGA